MLLFSSSWQCESDSWTASSFFSPFLVLGILYILYLRVESGLWLISKKATLSPFVSFHAFFVNLPIVSYEFLIALSPVPFLLAIAGVRRTARPYARLVLLLVLFHIVSLSFISHSTRRYSVEFVPITMVFAAEGICALKEYARRFSAGPVVFYAGVVLLAVLAGFLTFTPFRHDRLLQEAGLCLLAHDPGSVVAARLPLVAFYEKGKPVGLLSDIPAEARDVRNFERIVSERQVKYVVIDEETLKELPFLEEYVSKRTPVCSMSWRSSFVRVYRAG